MKKNTILVINSKIIITSMIIAGRVAFKATSSFPSLQHSAWASTQKGLAGFCHPRCSWWFDTFLDSSRPIAAARWSGVFPTSSGGFLRQFCFLFWFCWQFSFGFIRCQIGVDFWWLGLTQPTLITPIIIRV